MRHENQLSALTGTALGLLLAAGSIGCLQSAFSLTVGRPAALWGSVFLFSILYAQCLRWKQGSLAFACLLALTAGYLLRYGTAAQAAKQLLQHLSNVYDRAYHWGVLPWEADPAAPMDLPLGIWAAVVSLAAVRTVGLQKSCVLPVSLALIPLAACTVVTDTVPGEVPIFMLLAGILLLILPASVRRENPRQGVRLTAAAVLPVLLGLGLLFRGIPQESYVNHSAVIQENIRTAAAHLPQLMEDGLETTAANLRGTPARTVDLSRLGSRIPFTYPVMEVTAGQSGTLYLREADYDQYDGFGWTAAEDRQEEFFRQEGPKQTITIHTRGTKQVQYLPYYPAEPVHLTGGSRDNPRRQTEFSLSCTSLPEDWRKTVYSGAAEATGDSPQGYTTLPETTRQDALDFLAHALRPGASNTEKADIIAAMVTDCAAYSLSPSRMPAEEPDFALWFLRRAESGYCIHFATAAAVLLRAADVPARYVTGYMTEGLSGESVTVTEEDAHAWAEYFEPRLGCWIPLEATPAAQAVVSPPATPATVATTPATEPELPETVPATAPSQGYAPAQTSPVPGEEPGNALLFLLLLPLLALILAVQRSARLHLRRKRQHTGSPNAQALQRFREAEGLARLLKETPAEELIVLAQKAKYSQHEVTAEELQQFDSYRRSCLHRLKEKPLHLQLVFRYLYAAY